MAATEREDELVTGDPAVAAGASTVLEQAGFAHVARLELDQLLEQLIGRARDVQATQGRLRGLLRANQAIASAVDLDEVLQHILESAKQLVDARYAALGVVEAGRLVRFLHIGMEDGTVRSIGRLPEGKGLLGRLIDDPTPLRIADIGSHEASIGFPPEHPPMRSFLGVPIRSAGTVFGNLYLTDKSGGDQFSRDDEELVCALAAAAGAAITNATAFVQARQRQQWQTAMAALSTAVLTSDDPDLAPALILRHAATTIDCAGGSVVVPHGDTDHVRVVAAVGLLAEFVDVQAPTEGTIYGQVMTERRALLIDDLASDPHTAGRTAVNAGPTVAVPMLSDLAADGVLFLCRDIGAAHFDSVDLEMLMSYAAHAALVLQLARSRRDNELLRMVDDRAQIADALRTDVTQRLSRLGLDLQGLAARAGDAASAAALQSKVDDVDAALKALRAAISSL